MTTITLQKEVVEFVGAVNHRYQLEASLKNALSAALKARAPFNQEIKKLGIPILINSLLNQPTEGNAALLKAALQRREEIRRQANEAVKAQTEKVSTLRQQLKDADAKVITYLASESIKSLLQ